MSVTQHSKIAADRFDDWAKTYGEDRISRWFQSYQRLALDRLCLKAGDVFLDVGCGHGWSVRRVSAESPVGKAVGIDVSPKMIDKARMLSKDCPNCEFRVADSAAIPWEDNAFDAILSTFSIHHHADPKTSLSEIRRVLKPGGRFVLIDSARDVFFPIWLQDRFRRYLERSHVKYYTTGEMGDLLKIGGFEMVNPVETVRRVFDHNKIFTGLMIYECRSAPSV